MRKSGVNPWGILSIHKIAHYNPAQKGCGENMLAFFPMLMEKAHNSEEVRSVLPTRSGWSMGQEGWGMARPEIWKKCSSEACMFVFPKLVWKDLHPGNKTRRYSLWETKRGWDSVPMKGITALVKKAWEKFLILPTMWGPNHKTLTRKQKTDLSRHGSLIVTQRG